MAGIAVRTDSRFVVFLFTDIEDQAALLDRLGPERYREVSTEYRRLIREVFQRFGGREVDEGDPGFVAFERPFDAVTAACEIHSKLAAHPDQDVSRMKLRMGIHRGQAVPVREGFVGLDVHRAARISAVAHGGQVLVSDETVETIEKEGAGEFTFRDLGRHRLKDLSNPQRLFQLMVPGDHNDFPPLLTLEAFPTNLPVQLTPFIGREEQVAQVGDLLAKKDIRLVTLTGPGGVGKTRLALQAAAGIVNQFSDGIFFVSLAQTQSVDLLLPTIAQTLGIQDAGTGSLIELIANFAQGKKLLLVLDNLEHLKQAGAAIAQLIETSPSIKILATSRVALSITSELDYQVKPLALPDPSSMSNVMALRGNEAIALFIERAKAVKPQFELNQNNGGAVAGICERLDGLPLAIELAAARIRLFSPVALLSRLGEHLSLLSAGAKDLPARQQTIAATIEWSFQLLKESDRTLLARLSVFKAGCTLAAAEAVCDPTGRLNVASSLNTLTQNNLIQLRQYPDGKRVVILELIREFAHEVLDRSNETKKTTQRHAKYYLELVEHEAPKLHTAEVAEWSLQIEREFMNLRAALECAVNDNNALTVASLIGASWQVWFWFSQIPMVRDLLAKAGDLLDGDELEIDPHQLVDAYAGLSVLALWSGNHAEGQRFVSRLDRLAHHHDLTRGKGWALYLLAATAVFVDNDLERAGTLLRAAIPLARESGDSYLEAWSLNNLGSTYSYQGNPIQAMTRFDEALALGKRTGDKIVAAGSARNTGYAALSSGDQAKAVASFCDALRLSQAVTPYIVMSSLFGLAAVLASTQPSLAATLQAKAAEATEKMGLPVQPQLLALTQQTVTDLKSHLTEDEFSAAWQTGRAMKLEDVVELAIHSAK